MALVYQVTADGLVVPTQQDVVDWLTEQFQTIYGSDVNLTPSSPDGQLLNIFAQAAMDQTQLITQVYSGMDPDNAIGVTLDQRVAINGIARQAGTFTVTNVTVINDQSVNLYGLDQTVQPVYAVSDAAGNQYELQDSQLGVAAGTSVFAFQAAAPGALTPLPNTITIPVTILLGVLSVNNPTSYTTLGLDEETDAALRIRRQKSVSLSASGYYNNLLAALLDVEGVSFANIVENTTGSPDGEGVPGHSIWVIVAGSGTDADIAQAIYAKRSAGCGLYSTGGSSAQSFNITQLDGSVFGVVWDTVTEVPLFAKFTVTSLDGLNPPLYNEIRGSLPLLYIPGVAAQVNTNALATFTQEIDPNTLVTNAGFSLASGGSYTPTLTPAVSNEQFQLSSANVILLPMLLAPTTSEVAAGEDEQFFAYGGYGTYTYSISVNNSGGSINSSTGFYTAGTTASVTDTIHVVDGLSNSANASVDVT